MPNHSVDMKYIRNSWLNNWVVRTKYYWRGFTIPHCVYMVGCERPNLQNMYVFKNCHALWKSLIFMYFYKSAWRNFRHPCSKFRRINQGDRLVSLRRSCSVMQWPGFVYRLFCAKMFAENFANSTLTSVNEKNLVRISCKYPGLLVCPFSIISSALRSWKVLWVNQFAKGELSKLPKEKNAKMHDIRVSFIRVGLQWITFISIRTKWIKA